MELLRVESIMQENAGWRLIDPEIDNSLKYTRCSENNLFYDFSVRDDSNNIHRFCEISNSCG